MNNWKILGFLLLISICSCNNEKDDLQTHGLRLAVIRFWNDYFDYYFSKFQFEYEHNTKLINIDTLLNVFSLDSSNMIKLIHKNFEMLNPTEYTNLTVRQEKVNNTEIIRINFYKIFNVPYIEDFKKVLHIEYPVDRNAREKMIILSVQTLKPDNRDIPYKQAALINWINLPAYSDDFPCYMWGINKSTDTLRTNLSLESIKMLYPEFNGVYVFRKYDSIVVDYQYIKNINVFFRKIKFYE